MCLWRVAEEWLRRGGGRAEAGRAPAVHFKALPSGAALAAAAMLVHMLMQ